MLIYFDNELVPINYYRKISNNYSLFDNAFYLGSTSSNTFVIEIDKGYNLLQLPEKVKIDDGDAVYNLSLDSYNISEFYYSFTLRDKLVDFNIPYNAKDLIDDIGIVTLQDIFEDMCDLVGVETDYVLQNKNIEVTWYDNRIQAREYLSYIAELECGFAYIGADGKLSIQKNYTDSIKTILHEETDGISIGEKRNINRIVYDNGFDKWEYGAGETLYLRSSNVFLIDEEQVEYIYDNINGFEFYSLETAHAPIYKNIKVGDIITINGYKTIVQYNREYFGKWVGGYKLDIQSIKQEETQIKSVNEIVKNISTVVDRDSASLKILSQKVDSFDKSVKTFETQYYLSTSKSSLIGGEWTSSVPTFEDGKFLWIRNKIILNDDTVSYSPSEQGSLLEGLKGTSISSVQAQYYLSTSRTELIGGTWEYNSPEWEEDTYLWLRNEINYTNPISTEYTIPYVDSAWEMVNKVENRTSELEINYNEINGEVTRLNTLTEFIKTADGTDYVYLYKTPLSETSINKLVLYGFTVQDLYPNMAYPNDNNFPNVINQYEVIFSSEKVECVENLPLEPEENVIYTVNDLFWKYDGSWSEYDYNIKTILINSPFTLIGTDKLVFENNIVKIIDVDNNIYELEAIGVPTFNNGTYITVRYFQNLTYYAEYIEENDFTNKYQTQIQSVGSFNVTSNQVVLKVDSNGNLSEVGLYSDDKSGSKVKLKADDITLEGITTVNDNFKVLLDGSIEAHNGRFSGDVIIGNTDLVNKELGLLTTFMFPLTTTEAVWGNGYLGWQGSWESGAYKATLGTGVIIPENFTVISSQLFVKGEKTEWYQDEISVGFATCYNVKLKKDKNVHFASIMESSFTIRKSEPIDVGATGDDGITVGGSMGSEFVGNIPTSVFDFGINDFVLETDMEAPEIPSEPYGSWIEMYLTLVRVKAGIQVTGYYK